MPELKKARLYEKLKDNTVRCLVCPRGCVLKEGQVGFCGSRICQEGAIYSLIYGLVSSIAVDPIEKKPLFHFYPGSTCLSLGSFGCNFRCIHCQNWSISHQTVGRKVTEGQYISPQESVAIAKEKGARGISWTYNEPTIWHEYALDSAILAKKEGLYTVYVTNGYITAQALEELSEYLDAYRVDLKGWSKDFWKKVCQIDDPAPVFQSASLAKNKWKMHVEVVTNVIPTFNDDEETFRNIGLWIKENLGEDTPWHVTRFVPHLQLSYLYPTPVSKLEEARRIGLDVGLKYVYLGNVPGHPAENTYCPSCGQLLIERSAFWVTKSTLTLEKSCPKCGRKINIVGSIETHKGFLF